MKVDYIEIICYSINIFVYKWTVVLFYINAEKV